MKLLKMRRKFCHDYVLNGKKGKIYVGQQESTKDQALYVDFTWQVLWLLLATKEINIWLIFFQDFIVCNETLQIDYNQPNTEYVVCNETPQLGYSKPHTD